MWIPPHPPEVKTTCFQMRTTRVNIAFRRGGVEWLGTLPLNRAVMGSIPGGVFVFENSGGKSISEGLVGDAGDPGPKSFGSGTTPSGAFFLAL